MYWLILESAEVILKFSHIYGHLASKDLDQHERLHSLIGLLCTLWTVNNPSLHQVASKD